MWIDIVAVNQHPSEQQQDDLANLRTAIHMSKATLVVLDAGGAPLKRVWCLYECDNTITLHGPDRLLLMMPNFSAKVGVLPAAGGTAPCVSVGLFGAPWVARYVKRPAAHAYSMCREN